MIHNDYLHYEQIKYAFYRKNHFPVPPNVIQLLGVLPQSHDVTVSHSVALT
jgi:hypothetical protein